MSNNNVQPIFILPEDTRRTTGKDAQRNNIAAAKAVAQTVRTTLGPKGMDKMIVDAMGDVIVTNDGVTILKEMQIEHPAAKMIVEVAKTQEDAVGDGTTTAVVLAGELLKKAEDLLDQEIHPTVLARGYRLAEVKAQEILNAIAEDVNLDNLDLLRNIAITAMTGKGAESNKEKLADLAVRAVKGVAETINGKTEVDLADIKIEKRVGESSDHSELIAGIVLDKERVHPGMPEKVIEAKVALLDAALEIKNTEIDAKIQITDPAQLNSFLEQEERSLKEMVNKVKDSGATVLFCQKGIDDLAQHFLAKAGILAVRRVKKSDMEKLARATGAKITSNWKELTNEDLGFAGLVREEKLNDEEMIFVEQCLNPKAVTLLVRGGTEHVAEEIKRAVTDAIGDLAAALKVGKVVAGAGAVEMRLARELKEYASSLSGREQLAVQAFAETMEIIPRTLAENAGLDPIDVLTKLRSAEGKWSGINVFTGEVMDSWQEGVIEPLKIKTQALSSAAEVAEMILRIDDVIMGGSSKQGMPPGGMGMPPGMM
ncbi:MAG: TCP-1/cpn60 chaperonin family protein [Nanoarchaeota archaeon]|nr:TCP-1/cpn60 chaperonin family protein [Nanoarchaeota archaeon]MBU1622789.1 TCP-1/cpn60 chaperonin family protein [Nanoarchaeota archaeon]MBU1974294.1 TCP-1/cpn60 chaperonin family protein [Nanoarchaeota archaeon]